MDDLFNLGCMKETFTERQRFTQWWLWVLIGSLGAFAIYAVISQLIFNQTVGNNPMSNSSLLFFFIFVIAFVVFFYKIELRTKIDDKGIHLHFYPFFKSIYLWSSIEKIDFVRYGFVGYGIRFGGKYGTVYNIKGNRGFAIQLKDGKKYLIGSQETEKIKETTAFCHKHNPTQ